MKISIIVIILFLATNIYSQNVGINATGAIPDASSILDVKSTDKGLLIPRVDIADLSNEAPIAGAINSLLVYNTNTTTGIGYYYWNATTKWTKLVDASTPTDDHDWYEVGTTTAPDNINDDIFTQGKVGIGTPSPLGRISINTQTSVAGLNTFTVESGAVPSIVFTDVGGGDLSYISGYDSGLLLSDNYVNFSNAASSGIAPNPVLYIANGGKIGINTFTPTERLEINGSIKITDGTQGAGKVLVSDANGKGSWSTNVALVPTVIGSVGTSYHDFMLASSSNIPGWSMYLPVGKWVVSIGGLLHRTFTTNTYYGARLTLSSSSTSIVSTGFSYIGSSLVLNIKSTNNNATAPSFAGFVSGTILVNVTTAQTIYLWNNASDTYSVGSSSHGFGQNGENYFIATPIN